MGFDWMDRTTDNAYRILIPSNISSNNGFCSNCNEKLIEWGDYDKYYMCIICCGNNVCIDCDTLIIPNHYYPEYIEFEEHIKESNTFKLCRDCKKCTSCSIKNDSECSRKCKKCNRKWSKCNNYYDYIRFDEEIYNMYDCCSECYRESIPDPSDSYNVYLFYYSIKNPYRLIRTRYDCRICNIAVWDDYKEKNITTKIEILKKLCRYCFKKILDIKKKKYIENNPDPSNKISKWRLNENVTDNEYIFLWKCYKVYVLVKTRHGWVETDKYYECSCKKCIGK